jgi:hypothetical protein
MKAQQPRPVPDVVSVLAWRLMDGWRPGSFKPGRPTAVRWSKREISDAGEIEIEGGILTV